MTRLTAPRGLCVLLRRDGNSYARRPTAPVMPRCRRAINAAAMPPSTPGLSFGNSAIAARQPSICWSLVRWRHMRQG